MNKQIIITTFLRPVGGKRPEVERPTFRRLPVAFLLALFALAACDKEDGDWDPMVWKVEVAVQKTNGIYDVPATGAELTFSCKNYSFPWIEYAVSNEKTYYHNPESDDYHALSDDWFKAEISGNRLTVVFETNETSEERVLQLIVTAGDIFYTFKFKQLASNNPL